MLLKCFCQVNNQIIKKYIYLNIDLSIYNFLFRVFITLNLGLLSTTMILQLYSAKRKQTNEKIFILLLLGTT